MPRILKQARPSSRERGAHRPLRPIQGQSTSTCSTRSATPSSGATTPPTTLPAQITNAPPVYHSKLGSDPFPEKSATSAITPPSRILIPLTTIKEALTARTAGSAAWRVPRSDMIQLEIQGGVGAVSVVAFTYDIYTIPSTKQWGAWRNAYYLSLKREGLTESRPLGKVENRKLWRIETFGKGRDRLPQGSSEGGAGREILRIN